MFMNMLTNIQTKNKQVNKKYTINQCDYADFDKE